MAARRRSRNTLGSVEQLPSKRFRAYFRHEGEKITAPTTFENRQQANQWLAAQRTDMARGQWVDPRQGKITLAEWATDWLDSRTDLAESTRKQHRDSLDRWVLPYLGDARIDALTPPMVRRWFTTMSTDAHRAALARKAGRSGQTTHGHPARVWARANGYDVKSVGRLSPKLLDAWRKAEQAALSTTTADTASRPGATAASNAYRTLRACLNAAVRDGLIAASPCKVEGAGQVRHAERIPATPDEVAKIAETMPEELRAAVWVAAWGGLRFGELFALARKHVDLERGTVQVVRSLTRQRTFGLPKTASSLRTVWLPAFVVEHLAEHMARHTDAEPDALIFHATTGAPVRQAHVSKHFKRAVAAIGRPELRWHDLRHTGATLAYAAGGSVRDVQRRLGHSTTRAAMIYAHALDDGDRLLAERLGTLFGPSMGPPPSTPPPAPRLRLVPEHAEGHRQQVTA